MNKLLLCTFLAMLTFISCDSTSVEINYKELNFELPLSLNKVKSKFNINSDKTLRKGDIGNREILLYKDSNQEIIGITFYEKYETHRGLKEAHKKNYVNLEKIFNKKFKAFDFSFFSSLTGKYYLITLENGLTIVLGDVMYNLASNNYVTVSFFRNVNKKELITFLNNIY